jgi:hypothetical protein
MVVVPNETGIARQFDITDLYDDVAPLALGPNVPKEIARQFDLARSAYLYSWFEYELATLAEQHAYSIVEMAIKEKAKLENAAMASRGSLRKAIAFALKQGWLDGAEFETEIQPGVKRSSLDMMVEFRNSLMHGNPHLYPNGSLLMMEICHQVITMLFP